MESKQNFKPHQFVVNPALSRENNDKQNLPKPERENKHQLCIRLRRDSLTSSSSSTKSRTSSTSSMTEEDFTYSSTLPMTSDDAIFISNTGNEDENIMKNFSITSSNNAEGLRDLMQMDHKSSTLAVCLEETQSDKTQSDKTENEKILQGSSNKIKCHSLHTSNNSEPNYDNEMPTSTSKLPAAHSVDAASDVDSLIARFMQSSTGPSGLVIDGERPQCSKSVKAYPNWQKNSIGNISDSPFESTDHYGNAIEGDDNNEQDTQNVNDEEPQLSKEDKMKVLADHILKSLRKQNRKLPAKTIRNACYIMSKFPAVTSDILTKLELPPLPKDSFRKFNIKSGYMLTELLEPAVIKAKTNKFSIEKISKEQYSDAEHLAEEFQQLKLNEVTTTNELLATRLEVALKNQKVIKDLCQSTHRAIFNFTGNFIRNGKEEDTKNDHNKPQESEKDYYLNSYEKVGLLKKNFDTIFGNINGNNESNDGDATNNFPRHLKYKSMNLVLLGPNGTFVESSDYSEIDWSSFYSATRQLLEFIFTEEELQTHTISANPLSADYVPIPEDILELDPDKISDIIYCVLKKCAGATECKIVAVISTKCAEAAMNLKKYQQYEKE